MSRSPSSLRDASPAAWMPWASVSGCVATVVAALWVGALLVAPQARAGGGSATALEEAGKPAAMVTGISFTPRSDGRGYVVRVNASDRIQAYSMPRPIGTNELKWTLYDTGLANGFEQESPEGPIQRYDTAEQDGHVVLHFYLDPDRALDAEAYRDRASNDLLLNLTYTGASDAQPVPQPVASSSSSSGSASSGSASSGSSSGTASASGSSPNASPGSSAAASMFGTTQAARERWRLDTIVIDAGHGGKDPGATANGLREKDLVLKVAKKLGTYIEEKLDIDVVYTRTTDRFIELEERGHIANEAGAKLFISLHINAAAARSARGTETFFLGPHKTEAARKVMERENSVIRFEDNPEDYADYDEQALVRQTLAQSAYMRQSEKLASLIEHQFANRVQRRSRGVHQAGFYVLWSASMPAVLVELGFLTNRSEARFLNSERGQTYLASAIFRAVRDYKEKYEKGITRQQTR